ELMYDPATHATNQEWIEIYNSGPTNVNLAGWKFTKGISFTFGSLSLPVGGYRVVAADPAWVEANYQGLDNVAGPWSGTLANSGEALRLEDANGNKVDEITFANEGDWARRTLVPSAGHSGWDWFAAHAGTGKSAE